MSLTFNSPIPMTQNGRTVVVTDHVSYQTGDGVQEEFVVCDERGEVWHAYRCELWNGDGASLELGSRGEWFGKDDA